MEGGFIWGFHLITWS